MAEVTRSIHGERVELGPESEVGIGCVRREILDEKHQRHLMIALNLRHHDLWNSAPFFLQQRGTCNGQGLNRQVKQFCHNSEAMIVELKPSRGRAGYLNLLGEFPALLRSLH